MIETYVIVGLIIVVAYLGRCLQLVTADRDAAEIEAELWRGLLMAEREAAERGQVRRDVLFTVLPPHPSEKAAWN